MPTQGRKRSTNNRLDRMTLDIPPGELLTKVLTMLSDRPRDVSYKDISDKLNLPEPWIKAVATGQIKDPSVNRIEMLYEYLSGTPLNV